MVVGGVFVDVLVGNALHMARLSVIVEVQQWIAGVARDGRLNVPPVSTPRSSSCRGVFLSLGVAHENYLRWEAGLVKQAVSTNTSL